MLAIHNTIHSYIFINPFVGYTGEISAGIAGGALLLLGIVSLVLYRNWRYEQELDSLLWKVDYKEIQLHENDKDNNCQKLTRVSTKHCVCVCAYNASMRARKGQQQ